MTTAEHYHENLFGRLHNQAIVQLDPESLNYTTLWASDHHQSASLQHDPHLSMQVFSGLCDEYAQPFIIDVGAHIGTFSLVGAQNTAIRGWAFEPYSKAFTLLKRNIDINAMNGRFTLFNKALTQRSEKCLLRIPWNKINSHLSCLGYPNYRRYVEEVVESITLDALVAQADIDSVDIMRIDTEGSELHVLLGATDTINRYKPDLLIKFNWFKCAQSEIFAENLLNYVDVLGYQRSWIGDEDLLCRHPGRNPRRANEKFTVWGHETPKIALVKQKYDVFGPWQNEPYDTINPLKVLDRWPAKYTYFEMTQLYRADWYVLPYCHDSRIVREVIGKHRYEMDSAAHAVESEKDIPFEEYDVVISLDPVLRPSSASKTVFAYLQNEHHDSEYIKSLKKPLHGYDLFLDHMMEAAGWVYTMPQAVAFPYTRAPATVRTLKSEIQDNSIWIDNRFVMMLSHGNESSHASVRENIIRYLERETGARFRYRKADFNRLPSLQSPYSYLQELSRSRYYLNLIACGAGQGLCDAAALGMICFGTPKLKYHQAICHPNCLCNDLIDFKRKFDQVARSADLQQEILIWQDLMLADRMVRQPLHLLRAAVELKRKAHLNISPRRQAQPSCIITSLEIEEALPEVGKINFDKLKQLAVMEYDRNNFYDLIDYCQQALFFNDTDVEVYFILACAYVATDNKLKALECLAESKKIDPAHPPSTQLLNLIGADFINTEYNAHITRYDSCISTLQSYIEQAAITRIGDFDVANIHLYDDIIGDLVGCLRKGKNTELERMIIFHLGKQLKTAVATEQTV